METEPEKPREKTSAPSRKVRLAWWFGIYMAGQVPLIIWGLFHRAPGLLFVPFIFPWELGCILAPLLSIWPMALEPVKGGLLFFSGYVFYAGHLYETLKAPTRRRFDFLLLVLVIVVLVNQWILASMAGSISG